MRFLFRWEIAFCLCWSLAGAQPKSDSLAFTNFGVAPVERTSGEIVGQPVRQNFIRGFFSDEAAIWTSPFRIDQDDALVWSGVVAATAIVITVDEPISKDLYSFRNEHAWVQTVSPIATQFGQFYVPYSIAALYCLDGLVFDDNSHLDTGILEIQAMVRFRDCRSSIKASVREKSSICIRWEGHLGRAEGDREKVL